MHPEFLRSLADTPPEDWVLKPVTTCGGLVTHPTPGVPGPREAHLPVGPRYGGPVAAWAINVHEAAHVTLSAPALSVQLEVRRLQASGKRRPTWFPLMGAIEDARVNGAILARLPSALAERWRRDVAITDGPLSPPAGPGSTGGRMLAGVLRVAFARGAWRGEYPRAYRAHYEDAILTAVAGTPAHPRAVALFRECARAQADWAGVCALRGEPTFKDYVRACRALEAICRKALAGEPPDEPTPPTGPTRPGDSGEGDDTDPGEDAGDTGDGGDAGDEPDPDGDGPAPDTGKPRGHDPSTYPPDPDAPAPSKTEGDATGPEGDAPADPDADPGDGPGHTSADTSMGGPARKPRGETLRADDTAIGAGATPAREDVRWGYMEIVEPPRPVPTVRKGGRTFRAYGTSLKRPGAWYTDPQRRIWAGAPTMEGGATVPPIGVLLDCSGSMAGCWTDAELALIARTPGAWIGAYSGRGETGKLIILSAGGYRVPDASLAHPGHTFHMGGSNEVDGPALRALIARPGLRHRLWISDGQATAPYERRYNGAEHEAARIAKSGGVLRFGCLSQALEALKVGLPAPRV